MRPASPAPSTLPAPDAASSAHSARVVAAIRARIEATGRWIAFSDYMQMALYAPGLGYYVAGSRKFGADGDFVTAPELTPLFAQALALQVRTILEATPGRQIVEFGAGSGVLAADLLNALAAADALPAIYRILEVSPDLRERQHETLARHAPHHLARVAWIDRLPPRIDGVALMNEVLDAVPPHVIVRKGGAWFERGVVWRDRFVLDDRPLTDDTLRGCAMERFPAEGDYASELNPAAEALTTAIGARIADGALLVLDYGFPQAEYYVPQRSEGTLMAHYRHHALSDPLVWPGLADLTAHVDFTAIAVAGERGGLTVAGYASQATFLVNCGILDRLRECGEPTSVGYMRAAAAVQRLLSPAEMGELFKVLALAKREGFAWPGFATGDRAHRL